MNHATSTRTDAEQTQMDVCAWCHELFPINRRGNQPQRFCKPKCRAAYAREVGTVGRVVVIRKLKTRNSITLHTTDDRILTAPIGTKFRLVKEPEST